MVTPVRIVAVMAILAAAVGWWQGRAGGELTREAYAERMLEQVTDWPGVPSEAGGSGVRELAAGIDEQAGDLAELRAPAAIRAEHDRLVAGLRAYAAALRGVADAEAGGPAAVRAAAERATGAATEWAAAFTAIAQRGYATTAP